MPNVVKMNSKAHVMSCGFTSSSGGSIKEGMAVGINASGEACLATILATGKVPAVGVSLKSDTKGVFGTTVSYSFVEYANTLVKLQSGDWSWTPGGTVYLLSGNNFSQTAPTAANQMVQKIGHAIDATNIQVNIGTPMALGSGGIVSGI